MSIVPSIIKNLFGKKQSVVLAESFSAPAQQTIKVTPEVIRVDPKELEQTYISDPISFNAINKIGQMIMAAGYELRAKDKNVKETFTKFFHNIGNVGEDITFDEILDAVYRYQLIYGNAYVELVFNRKEDRIVDLCLIDPKRMDYAKDSTDKIILDEFGKPVGYALSVPYGTDTTGKGDLIPKEYEGKITLGSDKIFLLPKRICHFKLYTYGDRFYGLGLLEPAYKSILNKMNIEQANSNAIFTRGNPTIGVSVGDEQHEPTPQDIKSSLDMIVKLKSDRYLSHQHWIKPYVLESKQNDAIDNTLQYLRLNQTASLGMPEAFATGAGEKTNRATLSNQQQFLEFTLMDIVKRTLETIRKYMLRRICYYNEISEVPTIQWGDIGAEETDDKSARLNEYVKNGVLRPEEIHDYVVQSEGLKGIPEAGPTDLPPEENNPVQEVEPTNNIPEVGTNDRTGTI